MALYTEEAPPKDYVVKVSGALREHVSELLFEAANVARASAKERRAGASRTRLSKRADQLFDLATEIKTGAKR